MPVHFVEMLAMWVIGLGVTQRTNLNDGSTATLQILLIVVSNHGLVGVLHTYECKDRVEVK